MQCYIHLSAMFYCSPLGATHTRRSPGSWNSVGMPLSWDMDVPWGGSLAATHSPMWHTPVAHRVPSRSGWSREQAAPVTNLTGDPPVWRHVVQPVLDPVLITTYLPPPPIHYVYMDNGYVSSFHNTPDHLALRNVPIKLCITI